MTKSASPFYSIPVVTVADLSALKAAAVASEFLGLFLKTAFAIVFLDTMEFGGFMVESSGKVVVTAFKTRLVYEFESSSTSDRDVDVLVRCAFVVDEKFTSDLTDIERRCVALVAAREAHMAAEDCAWNLRYSGPNDSPSQETKANLKAAAGVLIEARNVAAEIFRLV
jgi:hypothetical protein